jgi:hypothetical protein
MPSELPCSLPSTVGCALAPVHRLRTLRARYPSSSGRTQGVPAMHSCWSCAHSLGTCSTAGSSSFARADARSPASTSWSESMAAWPRGGCYLLLQSNLPPRCSQGSAGHTTQPDSATQQHPVVSRLPPPEDTQKWPAAGLAGRCCASQVLLSVSQNVEMD